VKLKPYQICKINKELKKVQIKNPCYTRTNLSNKRKPPTKDVYERARILSLCLVQGKSFDKKLLLEGSVVRRQRRWRRDHSRHDDVGSS
jgi:hypothetical protein